ncbi:unnamed protein product [Blepharisma stoltei]|uniref:Altered inheritance of mitochondria protein 24, mitochondrial n=1 Tax=Blepharisma stoltei TaxID=1481888 RepID=A0AAU9J822_9CILI|nr:unnamed protein product [Blepharisma stoltei]
MQDIFKKDQYNFQLVGEPSQTLQLILLQNQSVFTNLPYIVYMSKNLKIKKTKNSWYKSLSSLFYDNPEFIHKIKNQEGALEYVGISKTMGGKIFGLNPKIFDGKMIIRFDALLAYTSEISIKNHLSQDMQMRKELWIEGSGDGIIFLQTPCTLIEKRLSNDEEILVSKNSIVAWSKNIRITNNTENNSFANSYYYGWVQANVKGPGVVYIEGNGITQEERKKSISNKRIRAFMFMFFFMIVVEIIQMYLEEFI